MVKGGSFKPGGGPSSAPRPAQGKNGPSDSGSGTTAKLHPNVGTNRQGGTGGKMPEGGTQWKPGGSTGT